MWVYWNDRGELVDYWGNIMSDYVIKDSGKREEFAMGSVRDTEEGKGRYDLLPTEALKMVAIHFQKGAEKYSERNWEKGQNFSRLFSSMLRHTFQALEGKDDEDHLVSAVWNGLVLLELRERIKQGRLDPKFNNMPWKETKIAEPLSEEDKKFLKKIFPLPSRAVSMETHERDISGECLLREDTDVNTGVDRSKILVYIAGKIRDYRGMWYQEQNIRLAEQAARTLWKVGFSVICPHTNNRWFDGQDIPADTFAKADLTQVERADVVLVLPNWKDSEGAKGEIVFAINKDIPVLYAPVTFKTIEEAAEIRGAYSRK